MKIEMVTVTEGRSYVLVDPVYRLPMGYILKDEVVFNDDKHKLKEEGKEFLLNHLSENQLLDVPDELFAGYTIRFKAQKECPLYNTEEDAVDGHYSIVLDDDTKIKFTIDNGAITICEGLPEGEAGDIIRGIMDEILNEIIILPIKGAITI